ncbi:MULTISPECIES: DinB family protein [Gracilimonas]|uniref:DinB family protein n=1 Tax=Gracilimonas sediminicola TaxID=2952158 RepID=A0A9X2L1N3_9BACT|nr:DinB family protein [Gracilimonas sediminicola]MCP9290614.1 DinB family protein [Gracilimonas sediminicola]
MTLKEQLLNNTDVFIDKINEFTDAQFNLKPDSDSWSAADVLEHVYRSEFGVPRLFTGETKKLNDRKPDAHVSRMKQRFLESDAKMEASGVILPTEGKKSRESLIEKFRSNRIKIAGLIEDLPADELCLKFEHPVFGLLTRMEWVHFSIIHSQRHQKQLDRIQSQLQ